MFRGLSAGQIDSKGRITIPANYRTLMVEESSGSLIVTIDPEEKILLLYPFPAWQVIEEKLESLPSFQPAARRIQRLLLGHATEVELDRQGRILLPNLLRDYA
ncbi:MAG: division/cell wall cluster transcriptional repressor MraZ, partial [Gammaproteobacteria bacterium]|nr:division/cell wall cluster transcriptional repressor MraZ [Gammaproteobacteria bacterium]